MIQSIRLGSKINAGFENGTDWPYLSPDGEFLFYTASVEAYRNSDVENGNYEGLRALKNAANIAFRV